ncbi:peroxisome biogenesis protein 19-1 [Selaginella moellendorffii]|nr:peroxisome biogenesis protein 19-1 [Selaginella moellendorffii]|eukprot:XP_002976649.2 peroxisome biogenesis protein 19-1 [Selaginella moellendorffii]
MAGTDESLDSLLDSALDDLTRDLAASSMTRQSEEAPVTPENPAGLGKGLPSLQQSKKKSMAKAAPPADPLAATLEKLAETTRNTVNSIDSQPDEGLLESLLGRQDLESLVGNFMQQILSKEILHEPMKEIGERYPSWLEANKSKLSKEDRDRFSKQHQLILELCRVYDTTPGDFDKITELMQSMQGCGQPPAEIVAELAPGLQLGEDGLPQLPILPGEQGGENANCSVM